MLARYHFENELGTGACGAVFRGREQGTGRVVAVKLLADSSADNGDAACAHACDERSRAPAVAHLAHPNISACYEVGWHGCLRYAVMELVEGTDLRLHTAAPNLLPLAQVLFVVASVADALDHAHACGVIHGDVKPANILFDAVSNSVKLADFPVQGTGGGASPGTPAYLSPERLCGDAPSAASDQFALGVTLYRLACGHPPFGGRSWPEVAHRVGHAPHADVRKHAGTLPAALARVIDRSLAKHPGDRFPSAGALSRALRQAQPHGALSPSAL